MIKKLKNIDKYLYPFISVVFIFFFWHILSMSGFFLKFILPPPLNVLKRLIESFPIMIPYIAVTVMEALLGLIIGLVLALLMSFLMDLFSPFKKAVEPLVLISQTVPYTVLAPLFVMWFGFGMTPKIVVVVLTCFFPIILNIIKGFESVPDDLITLLKSMGAGKIRITFTIKLPYALPFLVSGIKISAAYSIMAAVIAEWMGGADGIGVFISRARYSYDYELVLSSTILISILSSGLYYMIDILGKKIVWWKNIN